MNTPMMPMPDPDLPMAGFPDEVAELTKECPAEPAAATDDAVE
jgi:hypothetical protein